MNRSIYPTKITTVFICFLFFSTCFLPKISGKREGYIQNENINSQNIINDQEKVLVTCYSFGLPGEQFKEMKLPVDDAFHLFNKINELNNAVASHISFSLVRQLEEEIIELVHKYHLLPKGTSISEVKKNLVHSSEFFNTKKLILPVQKTASEFFCTMVTTGSGSSLPIIILPRVIPFLLTPIPRLLMRWNAKEAITSCGGLRSGTGFIAYGQQKGVALGFWGLGFTFSLPPLMGVYGLIGYALFAHVSADEIEYYPPNNLPEISQIHPEDGAINIPLDLSELRFQIFDYDGDLMNYTVTTTPNIGSGSGTLQPDGIYSIPISGIQGSTEYVWHIDVTDGFDTRSKEFSFTTVFEAPIVSNPVPPDDEEYIPLSLSQLNFTLVDYQGDVMSYSVETNPDIGSGYVSGVGNGTYHIAISNLEYFTRYSWWVNVTDGIFQMNKKFMFTTIPEGILVLYPTDDSTVRHGGPNSNSGSSESINVRNDFGGGGSPGCAYDTLIKFDTSTIPRNVTIQYAYLRLYYYKYKDNKPAGRTLNVYRATNDWDEETVTWNTQPSYASFPTTSAQVPSSIGTWMVWDVTSDLQDFFQGSIDNYGWKITDENYWGQVNIPIIYYYSKEYGDFTPILEIGVDE
jgi:hypothetical protein